jgi:NAD-dependent dihydropyrimidine dehydrogenase PreA subunit
VEVGEMDFEVVVDKEKCVGCGTCTYSCPKSGKVWNIGEKAVWCENGTENLEYCHRCANCVLACPQRAITISVS